MTTLLQRRALHKAWKTAEEAWLAASTAAAVVAGSAHEASDRGYWHDQAVRYVVKALLAAGAAEQAMLADAAEEETP